MITLFAIPKAFDGHIGVIQRNAFTSWTKLEPTPEIFVFGDDPGAAEVSEDLGLRHFPEVRCSEYGTPLLDDIFAQAQEHARFDVVCYVNADIMLTSDFLRAVQRAIEWNRPFLLVARRYDVDITDPWDFSDERWEERLHEVAHSSGSLIMAWACDTFAFPKGAFGEIPPFAVGRTAFDAWLLWRARDRGAAVIDATAAVAVVHQNHDYKHIGAKSSGFEAAQKGPEGARNLALCVDLCRLHSLDSAGFVLTPDGSIRRNRSRAHRQARVRDIWREVLYRTRSMRSTRLGRVINNGGKAVVRRIRQPAGST